MTKTLNELSLLDPHVQSYPFDFYRLLHEEQGIYQMPETGFYVISRYEDVRTVLLNPSLFSSDMGGFNIQDPDDMAMHRAMIEADGFGYVATLQNADMPAHARHRKIAEQIFTAHNVKQLIPRMEELTHDLIDRFIDRGECEFVADFALPLPGTILAEQLGLPRNDYNRFKIWVDASLEPATRRMTREELEANAKVSLTLRRFLADALEERRIQPREDFLSYMVLADQDSEEPLSVGERLSIAVQLMMAGFETTMSSLANGLLLLIEHPDQMAKLRAEPAHLKTFVEEVLRHTGPVQGLPRRVLQDTEIAGTNIPAGSVLMVRYGAANHDASKFACPHMFDIERKNASSHMSFGQGIHFCVGRLLARQEMLTAFGILLDRMDDIALARPLPDPPYEANLILRPLKVLPITFRKTG